MDRDFLWQITVKTNEFFNQNPPVSTKQINWTFFTQVSKILAYFRHKYGRVCFLTLPVIPLIFVDAKMTFIKNFFLKRHFQRYVTKLIFLFEILIAPPPSTPIGVKRSSIFLCTDSFLKNTECVFFQLLYPSCTSRDIWQIRAFNYTRHNFSFVIL